MILHTNRLHGCSTCIFHTRRSLGVGFRRTSNSAGFISTNQTCAACVPWYHPGSQIILQHGTFCIIHLSENDCAPLPMVEVGVCESLDRRLNDGCKVRLPVRLDWTSICVPSKGWARWPSLFSPLSLQLSCLPVEYRSLSLSSTSRYNLQWIWTRKGLASAGTRPMKKLKEPLADTSSDPTPTRHPSQ